MAASSGIGRAPHAPCFYPEDRPQVQKKAAECVRVGGRRAIGKKPFFSRLVPQPTQQGEAFVLCRPRFLFAALLLLELAAPASRAEPITQIVAFGDSLSDTGNLFAASG